MRKGRGEVKKVGDLFEKYKKTLIAPQKTVINAFIEVVGDMFNIEIDPARVKYTPSTKTLSVAVQGPLKSELQLRRDEILTHMKGRLGEKNAPHTIL
ncbi:MAG: hypothetical protein WDZ68_00420 [Candidatus Paceibacterota bacterium]